MGAEQSRAQGAATLDTKTGEHKSFLAAAEDAGYLKRPELLRAYFRKKAPQPALQELPEVKGLDRVTVTKLPIIYRSTVDGLTFRIHDSQLAAFLLDNGIRMMARAEEMEKHLHKNLSTILPVSDCRCIEKYSLHGKTEMASLGGESGGLKLAPGDTKFRIRIDEDFVKYTNDPAAYEDKLKSAILQAMGLDAEKYPAAKYHIKIEKVEQGSVVVGVVIGLCLFALAAVPDWWAPSSTGTTSTSKEATRPARQPAPPLCLTATPNNGLLRREVSDLSLAASSDGSFEITGHFVPSRGCYLPGTLFQKSFGEYVEARALQVDSEVLGTSGNKMRVMSKVEHGLCKRDLVALHTAQAVLTITADHRVAIEGDTGIRTEAEAGKLHRGMKVYVGNRPQELTRISTFSSKVEAGIWGYET